MFIGQILVEDDVNSVDLVRKIKLVDFKSSQDAMESLKNEVRSYLRDFSQNDLNGIIVQINIREFDGSQMDLMDLSDNAIPYPGGDQDLYSRFNANSDLDQW